MPGRTLPKGVSDELVTQDPCLLAGPSGRVPARKSTRDLIGSLRQQAGLPSATAQLPQPQLQPQPQGQQRTLTVQAAGSSPQPAVPAGAQLQQQELHASMPQVATLIQRPLSATNPAYDLSVESSEAHTLTDQPQLAAVATAVTVGQPVLPQSGLMELVSNPLYARSVDISRTTSTSPTRVEANAVAKQAEPAPESMLSEAPTGGAIVQVSDQPILSESADLPEIQASGSAVSLTETLAEDPAAEQLVQSSATATEGSGTAMVSVAHTSQQSELQDNPSVLQVSDQPIFTPEPDPGPQAAPAEVLSEAKSGLQVAAGDAPADMVEAAQQMSAQPILASTETVTAPAEESAIIVMSQHAMDPSMTAEVADHGVPSAVSDQPILGLASSQTSQAVPAEALHEMSSRPALGPVITQPLNLGATSVATQPALFSSPPVPSQELQVSQQTAQSLANVSTEPAPVMSSQPQLGPVLTSPGDPAAMPPTMQQAPLSSAPGELQVSQQPAQPLRRLSTEPTPVMSSQPLLRPELAQPEAAPQVHQVPAPQQQQLPLQGLSCAESITGLQHVSGASTPPTQVSMVSQGSVLRPPLPALPTVRRSRSDLRSSQQAQPSSVRRSISILPATPESAQARPNAPLGPSPMPQLRRSITSLPTSPVPQIPRTATASQAQLQQVVLQQAPLNMQTSAHMQQIPLGPLQEGIAPAPLAPPQHQASSHTLVQLASQPPAPAVLSAAPVVAPRAAAPVVDPQEVHLTVTNSPQLQPEPSVSTVSVEQSVPPADLQASQFLPQQPEAAMVSQGSAVQLQALSPSSPAVRQQAELEPQATEVFEASAPRQHSPPVFMRSFEVGAPQHAQPRSAHSPQIMRTNTWSPSPNILQPALPGQAGPAQNVQGPLSMGFQQSWNNPVPALPEVQVAPMISPPGAEQDTVPPNSPPLRAYASLPVQQAEGDSTYGRSMPMTGAAAGYAVNSRAYTTGVSVPMASGSSESFSTVAPASMAMNHLEGLGQQVGRQHPRQQPSMSSRTVPPGLVPGTVIQPMQGPVVVGEQSAAVTTESTLTHSQGFSIQPLSHSPDAMQANRGFNSAMMQAGFSSQQQQQPEASRRGGGGIAKRILQDFGRSSRSSFNAGPSVNASFQSDRSLQQVVSSDTTAFLAANLCSVNDMQIGIPASLEGAASRLLTGQGIMKAQGMSIASVCLRLEHQSHNPSPPSLHEYYIAFSS